MIKFLLLDFLSVWHRIPFRNKKAVYRLQISALVPETLKFEKWVKYANEMTNDVIHSTKYYASINFSGAHPPQATAGHLLTLPAPGVGHSQFYSGSRGWTLAYPWASPRHLTHVFSKDR